MYIAESIFCTELQTIEGQLWAGQEIKANTFEEAEKYKNENGLGYLTVLGKKGFEFKTFEFN